MYFTSLKIAIQIYFSECTIIYKNANRYYFFIEKRDRLNQGFPTPRPWTGTS